MSVVLEATGPAVALPSDTVITFRELTFPGDLQSVPASREQVMQFVREYCSDETDEIDLMIALHEALVNAALHGCGNDASKTIHCSLEIQPAKVCVIVRDPGPGFDFERIADPDRFDTTRLEHGRGIALMRGVVDEVSFSRSGSEVRLVKRMGSPEASASR